MMSRLFGNFWALAFYLVTFLFLYCLVIYGFDIQVSGGRKALTSMITNADGSNEFYKIDDQYGFELREEEDGLYEVESFNAYKTNGLPFCLTCGWNKRAGGEFIYYPHVQGDLIYSIYRSYDYEKQEDGDYPTFNLKTKQFGSVSDLKEISEDADDFKHRMDPAFVKKRGKLISYFGSTDYDCEEAFMSVYAVYVLLAIWAGIAYPILRRKRKKLV